MTRAQLEYMTSYNWPSLLPLCYQCSVWRYLVLEVSGPVWLSSVVLEGEGLGARPWGLNLNNTLGLWWEIARPTAWLSATSSRVWHHTGTFHEPRGYCWESVYCRGCCCNVEAIHHNEDDTSVVCYRKLTAVPVRGWTLKCSWHQWSLYRSLNT